jgi:hypothetical protein
MRVHFDGFLVLDNQISILIPSLSIFYPFLSSSILQIMWNSTGGTVWNRALFHINP